MTATMDRTTQGAGVAGRLSDILSPLVGGELPVRLTAWDGSTAGPEDAPKVTLYSPNVLRRLLWNPGELGAAQAYVLGELDVEGDLGDVLTHVWKVSAERGLGSITPTPSLVLAAVKAARSFGAFGRPLAPPASQAQVKGRLHSLARDREAIGHHYDLSNDFYQLILDENMAYSSGYWTSDAPDYTLEDSQTDKLDLVCRKVGLDRARGLRFLDVGCGWGSLSLHAAREYGARVVGITISAEQKAFVDAKVRALGLEDWVEIRLQDYREIPDGPFDAVASIEMGEHVGEDNYPTYVKALHDNVIAGGRVLIQQMSRTGPPPRGRSVHRVVHRAGHVHAARRSHCCDDRGRWTRSAGRPRPA